MMQLPFWQELGVDPILLGQPKVYITGSDPNYLLNTSAAPASSGDLLNTLNRFNDSAFNHAIFGTTNKAEYIVLAGQPHPFGYISWANTNATGTGYYRVGSTTDMSFMHQLNGVFTVYWVHKNDVSEATGSTKILGATTVSSGNRGFLCAIYNSGSNRLPNITVYNDTAAQNVINSSAPTYAVGVDNPIVLYSWRGDLSKSIGQDACWMYVNGILNNTTQIINNPVATAASNTVLNIGNRNTSSLRFHAYVGDFIIFNALHDEATHLKVCNYLRKKWHIS